MREQNEAFERLRPNYEAVGSRAQHLRDPGMAIQPVPMFSSGGVVGSTPVSRRWVPSNIFFNAPRFQDGLAANEYPAILHAGETVTPSSMRPGAATQVVVNTPQQMPPQITVNVMNNAGAEVSTQSQQTENGGMNIDIMIDQMVSAKMRDGGSQISRTMSTMGVRPQPLRR
jgi:hypothetical protein